MGKKRLLVFQETNKSKRPKKPATETTTATSTDGRRGTPKKVGKRFSIKPSTPPSLAYTQPESPSGVPFAPIPQGHSSPYPTRQHRNSIIPPQPDLSNSIASPILSPLISSGGVTPANTFSLHTSPVPTRTRVTRSGSQNFQNNHAEISRETRGKENKIRSTKQKPKQSKTNEPKHVNSTQDITISPLIAIPSRFNSIDTAPKPKKKRKKVKRALVYHPPKSTKKKKKKPLAVPKMKKVNQTKKSEVSKEKEGFSPLFVPVKVEGGEMINLQATHCSTAMKSDWKQNGDIRFSVGTTTEQFRWGMMEIVPSGSKPASLTQDWMFFHLKSGRAGVTINDLSSSLQGTQDTLLVPPGHSYSIANKSATPLRLVFCVIALS